jgi:hypothetical protein
MLLTSEPQAGLKTYHVCQRTAEADFARGAERNATLQDRDGMLNGIVGYADFLGGGFVLATMFTVVPAWGQRDVWLLSQLESLPCLVLDEPLRSSSRCWLPWRDDRAGEVRRAFDKAKLSGE